MKLRDPCKRCIVRAGCSVKKPLCPERQDYLDFKENVKDVFDRLTLAIMTISFSTMVGWIIFQFALLAF